MYIMRHKKSQKFNNEPIVNMTEKEENVIYIEFNKQQKKYYNKLYQTAKQRFNYYKSIGNIGRGSISILAALHPARQACSGHIYYKNNIEKELNNAQEILYRIKTMVNNNKNKNLSSKELFEMAKEEAFNSNDGECPICFECPFDEPLQTLCRHIFCGECIITYINSSDAKCPLCRKPCPISSLKKPYSAEKEQQEQKDNNDDDDDEEKNNDKEELDDDDDDEIKFDSKLKRLIIELKKIKKIINQMINR